MVTVADVDLGIDVHAKRAAYLQLADKIKAAIDSGELQPRDQVPSLTQLTEQTGLSMGTVQKTIRSLEKEHYVYTVAGRGIFVTPRNLGPRE